MEFYAGPPLQDLIDRYNLAILSAAPSLDNMKIWGNGNLASSTAFSFCRKKFLEKRRKLRGREGIQATQIMAIR